MHQENQTQIQIFTCGYATFKNILQKNKEIIQKSQLVQITLKNNKWYITDGYYQKQNWKEIFPYMSECSAQLISLYNNNRLQIISQIQNVHCSDLKQLYLGKNKISNIQSLIFIQFNCLQFLSFSDNQISQIKCLNKLSTPSLGQIYLASNPIIQINALTRSKINLRKFKELCLQYNHQRDPINEDFSVIVKLSKQSIENFYVYSNKRINQVQVQSMLKLRFASISIKKKW